MDVEKLNTMLDSYDSNLKYVFSNTDKEQIRYDDMQHQEVRDMVVKSVEEFNNFFCTMCDDIHIVDTFLVNYKALQTFRQLVGKDLEHHLANGWQFMNRNMEEKMPCSSIPSSEQSATISLRTSRTNETLHERYQS